MAYDVGYLYLYNVKNISETVITLSILKECWYPVLFSYDPPSSSFLADFRYLAWSSGFIKHVNSLIKNWGDDVENHVAICKEALFSAKQIVLAVPTPKVFHCDWFVCWFMIGWDKTFCQWKLLLLCAMVKWEDGAFKILLFQKVFLRIIIRCLEIARM